MSGVIKTGELVYILQSGTVSLIMLVTRRSTLGDRAFAVARPRAWNNLPDAMRHSSSLATFKRSLKTHPFLRCFIT